MTNKEVIECLKVILWVLEPLMKNRYLEAMNIAIREFELKGDNE